MRLLKKYGYMYIKLDDHNEPEYGFEVSGNKIERFVPLCDKPINEIVLPKIVESQEFDLTSIDMKSQNRAALYHQKKKMRDYIRGSVKLCDGCFHGISKAKIVVPFENSVMIDLSSFDKDAEIEFVMPENLTLKQINRTFDAGYDDESDNWTVIADKKIAGTFDMGSIGSDTYTIAEYNANQRNQSAANFTIGKPLAKHEYSAEDSDEDQLTIL